MESARLQQTSTDRRLKTLILETQTQKTASDACYAPQILYLIHQSAGTLLLLLITTKTIDATLSSRACKHVLSLWTGTLHKLRGASHNANAP